MLKTYHLSQTRVERIIAILRVALAGSSLLAIWLDPEQPIRYTQLTHALQFVYFSYAVVLAATMWRRDGSGRWPLATHVTDIGVASVFQYLTLGPSSPFFVYFSFALFSAALRWGWRGTVRTTGVVLVAFITVSVSLSLTLGPTELELTRFVIRITYLLVVATLLTYLGQHEERLRDEIRRLARWPLPLARQTDLVVPEVVEYSVGIVGATRSLLVWSHGDEPWTYVAAWPSSSPVIERHAPDAAELVIADAVNEKSFVWEGPDDGDLPVQVGDGDGVAEWIGAPLHVSIVERLGGRHIASAPFATDHVSGRVFFGGLRTATAEILPLVQLVSREIGASLDQLYSYERSRELAITEDRLRLARDLHDGVLQSLTGIRLELQNMATAGASHAPAEGDRLMSIERALALEQRELRRFIDDLRPTPPLGAGASLTDRLDELRRRIVLEWRASVSIVVSPCDLSLPDVIDRAVPLMVHEGIVNALKHGHPSRVSAEVRLIDGSLQITVTDDGRGFAFRGRRDHAALVTSNAGPQSLRERVTSFGGCIAVESTPSGSRVELVMPVEAVHA